MSPVLTQTHTSSGSEKTQELSPSEAWQYDTGPLYTPLPKAQPLNVPSEFFGTVFNVKESHLGPNGILLSNTRAYDPATPPPISTKDTQLTHPPQLANTLAPLHLLMPDGERQVVKKDRYEELLERIEDEKEDLRDARDDVVGSRFRLRTKRKKLRETRQVATTQAGAAFDLVKRYLLEQAIHLPDHIQTALSDADNARDDLGVQEVEYEEAEDKYNLEEWRYTEKENAFVNGLSRSALSPNPAPMRGPNEADMSGFAFSFADDSNSPAPELGRISPPASFQPPELVENSESSHSMQWPQQPVAPPLPPDYLPNSIPFQSPPFLAAEHSTRPVSQRHDDDPRSHASVKWSDTCRRIDTWLLDIVICSTLEKGRLKSLVSKNDYSDDDWWKLVTQTWNSENSEDNVFHTGDTTVSFGAMSEPVSATTMRKLFAIPDTENLDDTLGPPALSPTPFLLEDGVTNALEVFDIPATLEPEDLIDDVPKQVTFMASPPSPPSTISTALTVMTLASSGMGAVSNTAEADHSSCTSSEQDGTIRRGQLTTRIRSNPVPPVDSVPVAVPAVLPSLGSASRQQQPFSEVEQLLPSTARPRTPDSDRSLSVMTPRQHGSTESSTPMTLSKELLSESNARPCPPGSECDGQCLVAPFLWINSAVPWAFPLLRLTPFSKQPFCPNAHRFEYFPFISMSNSELRLPGPTKFSDFIPEDVYD
ncbi:hypothetical protein BKA66DRAFT_443005 [Pyrenochaeta sp. MPI-SDFR-AT-0127]|nr:hypothetical protein BKA66DRAFT_443005 [Pyrenochaeta sp. MPI-SDFR-AT-0127]